MERQLGISFQLRLGANESNFGISPLALEAMQTAAGESTQYGDPQCLELREALATAHEVGVQNILIGSGIDELLGTFVRIICNPGDRAVTTLGSYPTFEFSALAHGVRLEHVPYSNDRLDLDNLLVGVKRHNAKILYIANPDNPSGSFLHSKDLSTLLGRLPEDCVLLLDEAYSDFVTPKSLMQPTLGPPNLVRLRTFSKAYGLAGLRIGYAIADQEYVSQADKIRPHFGVNRIAQTAAIRCLADKNFLSRALREVAVNRTRLSALGSTLGFDPLPSWTNFVTFALENRDAADRHLQDMLRHGIFIRKPSKPPLDRCIRVTVPNNPQLDLLSHLWPKVLQDGEA